MFLTCNAIFVANLFISYYERAITLLSRNKREKCEDAILIAPLKLFRDHTRQRAVRVNDRSKLNIDDYL